MLSADEKDDAKAVKGAWTVEKAILMGADQTELFKTLVLTMDDGKYTVKFGENVDKGTYKIDATAKPKRVSITSTEGPMKDKTLEAIYDLDGDTLKVCYALDGKEAPKTFESKEGTQTFYVVYKRSKDKPEDKEKKKDK
jgi:uncharacterized protein (TIGR03067 family)